MLLFCRKIIVNKPEMLKKDGPLLLACNHPNSFLDAVILLTLFKRPVHSLARGDVFKKPFYVKLLNTLKIHPVYRTSEGVENLNTNYETFEICRNIFREHGIVLIFSEGRCINEWHLRPLKKGTARLSFLAWQNNIPLVVLPVGINYSSFRRFGKNMFINFGEVIRREGFDLNEPDGKRYQQFNNRLDDQLQKLVLEIEKNDLPRQKKLLEKKPPLLEKILLFPAAIAGLLLHFILYLPLKSFTVKKSNNNDHYDSILTALLVFSYPFYLLLLTLTLFLVTKNYLSFLLLIILPFTAWAYLRLKPQLDVTKG